MVMEKRNGQCLILFVCFVPHGEGVVLYRIATTGNAVGQVLHSSARTTAAVHRAIQRSQASVNALAAQYAANPKTVLKWKRRSFVHDTLMGPKQLRSRVLTPEYEAACVAFRTQTLLSLHECLYVLQAAIPGLTRSSLLRCFQRHGISRLPDSNSAKSARKNKA